MAYLAARVEKQHVFTTQAQMSFLAFVTWRENLSSPEMILLQDQNGKGQQRIWK